MDGYSFLRALQCRSMTSNDPIFAQLNEPQRQAVEAIKGPSLILAGAGSGKTRALTHRIAYLMSKGVPPWQILAVTFTNKASKDMKERITGILNVTEEENVHPWSFGTGRLPVMGTFHSICARILRREMEHLGRDKSFVIYDTDDQVKLMKSVLKEMGIDDKELKPKAVLGYIGRFKCEALSPKEAVAQASTSHMQQVVRAYAKYQEALIQSNALDFDDLIMETVRLFHTHEDVLDRYQETWKYLHIDEYQDTNHSQYLLISLLAKKYRNLCVIGDPDQSIYSFRGADIRNILEFEKEYPEAVHIKLEQNYRSTQTILDAADAVINLNPDRPEKKMWTETKEGPKVLIHEVTDERKEAMEALVTVEKKRKEGVSLSDQVILYRTNAQSRLFEEACMRAGVPYRIIGGVKFYARKEIKDVLAYMHILTNPNDTVSLLRIINVPSRKIGLTTMGKIQAYASEQNMTLWQALCDCDNIVDINNPTKERLNEFTQFIRSYQAKSKTLVASQLASDLLEAVKMEQWVRDDTEEGESRWQNIRELITVMHKYDNLEPEVSLISFLEEVALVSEVDSLREEGDESLTLMTLHLCKGLEFEHVIVAGCEEGIFPHSNSLFDKSQLEEECRIMYVGMTRAKKHLSLMHASSRNLYGEMQANAPSRFLEVIPEELAERRNDEVLSAFAWAMKSGQQKAYTNQKVSPYLQHKEDIDIEFNQDIDNDHSFSQSDFSEGTRVRHPSFGPGTIVSLRGDIAEIVFDAVGKKNLALSIAPLSIL